MISAVSFILHKSELWQIFLLAEIYVNPPFKSESPIALEHDARAWRNLRHHCAGPLKHVVALGNRFHALAPGRHAVRLIVPLCIFTQ